MLYKALHIFTALVWLANGLLCKVCMLVPRHEAIVARILGHQVSQPLTVLIGLSEILMAVWIWTGIKSRWNAVAQMSIVSVMNVLEFVWARDLLLWGHFNAFFAALFVGLVFYTEFILKPRTHVS